MSQTVIEEVERSINNDNYPPLAEKGYGQLPAKAWNVYKKAFEMWPTDTEDCADDETGEAINGWVWDERIGDFRRPNDVLDKLLQEYCE